MLVVCELVSLYRKTGMETNYILNHISGEASSTAGSYQGGKCQTKGDQLWEEIIERT